MSDSVDNPVNAPEHTTIAADLGRIREAIANVYRGQQRAIDLVVCGWLAGGHILLEDIPGVGKTTLAPR